jgi:DNA-damage-inducible protein D
MSEQHDDNEQMNDQETQDIEETQDATSDQETRLTLEAFYADAKERIRYVIHEGKPWYSVVDVVGLLTDSPAPRQYWGVLKKRLQDEGAGQTLTDCLQLKMLAPDGRQRLTDAANQETLLRIIQSIPSPKAEPFKQWLASVGHERLEEMRDPALAADRMRREYAALGYSDEWIAQRLKGIVVRDDLTQEWRERGAKEGKEFAILTDTMHRGTFDISTAEHRKVKAIGPRRDLRDSMNGVELALTGLTEATARMFHQAHDSQGFDELHSDAHEAGEVGGAARRDIEARAHQPVVSAENYKTLRQARQRELQSPLFPDATPEE